MTGGMTINQLEKGLKANWGAAPYGIGNIHIA